MTRTTRASVANAEVVTSVLMEQEGRLTTFTVILIRTVSMARIVLAATPTSDLVQKGLANQSWQMGNDSLREMGPDPAKQTIQTASIVATVELSHVDNGKLDLIGP